MNKNKLKLYDKLVDEAKLYSEVENRSVTGQIEYWAKIGKFVEENPNTTFNFIKDILMGLEELEQGLVSNYEFG